MQTTFRVFQFLGLHLSGMGKHSLGLTARDLAHYLLTLSGQDPEGRVPGTSPPSHNSAFPHPISGRQLPGTGSSGAPPRVQPVTQASLVPRTSPADGRKRTPLLHPWRLSQVASPTSSPRGPRNWELGFSPPSFNPTCRPRGGGAYWSKLLLGTKAPAGL